MASCFLQTPERQYTVPRPDTTEEVRRRIRSQRDERVSNVEFMINEFDELSMQEGNSQQVCLILIVFAFFNIKFTYVHVFQKLFYANF